jgi:E3 ubiquitin-protein ligase HERC2
VQVFNQQLERVIPFVDLNVPDQSQRIGARLKSIRHLVLMKVKSTLMDTALRATANRGHHRQPNISINRYQAQQSKEQGCVTPDTSKCSFVQVFQQMYNKIKWSALRSSEKVFRVTYAGGLGELGIDAGGPYRETMTEVCTDLFSDVLDLFIPSPNRKDERGQTRDRYVPNPDYTSPNAIKMYEFVGVWVGLSFRTKANLPFQLPSMVRAVFSRIHCLTMFPGTFFFLFLLIFDHISFF